MTVAKSIKMKKPGKPYPSYELNANTNGQWSKRIRGKLYNFGTWDDPESALAKYKAHILDWADGVTRQLPDDGLSLRQGINQILAVLEDERDDGEVSPEHFDGVYDTLVNVIPSVLKNLDLPISRLKPSHFRRLKKRFKTLQDGSEAAGATMMKHVRHTKLLFSWLLKEGEIDSVPSYGARFAKLTKKQDLAAQNSSDLKQYHRDEILSLLGACGSRSYRIKAMVFLAVNGGMGPTDIAKLTFDEIDMDDGWIVSSRSKTTVRRCFKLWPETREALKVVFANRFEPTASEHRDLVFITRMKRPFSNKGAISRIFAKLQIKAKVKAIKGRGFYSLRHTCRDIANQQSDDTASRWIMGHTRQKIDDTYIRNAPRDRIESVCDHVHGWLFGGAK